MTATQDTRRYRAKKRAKGLCIYGGCQEPLARGGLCLAHWISVHNKEAEARTHQNANGLCSRHNCPNPALPGFTSCDHHLDLERQQALARYARKVRAQRRPE